MILTTDGQVREPAHALEAEFEYSLLADFDAGDVDAEAAEREAAARREAIELATKMSEGGVFSWQQWNAMEERLATLLASAGGVAQ